ncbi:DNA polymerase III, epsilon subunit [Luminiphilus syltensis NOR5-1B]|uniref:DNA polymerase III subunit epsilon n=1 Tax=Luminiphilus syltensis NOR5-1B TaxID=565045 RepID=B8KSC6_9GAMM|nr:DNA polymerase III subunit epsilon [Luminiphilus syltensis]EED36376.1 DNA polymerase III, epsilon subunit [Luminiphilus syltensis NOR5-1B]
MRHVVLDTETTGLEVTQGHRIIEIGCVELVNRKLTGNHYHQYVQPQREIDPGAMEVHGITPDFLADKPTFDRVADEFLAFIDGAELIIHNAPFDVGFIDAELDRLGARRTAVADHCRVTDSLVLARRKHPGQRNSLDALCQRYGVDNSTRTLHGALLDAEILADVFLLMTGGQTSLGLSDDEEGSLDTADNPDGGIRRLPTSRPPLRVMRASAEELARHEQRLDAIAAASGGPVIWREQQSAAE